MNHLAIEAILQAVLLELAIIILAARLCAIVARLFGQPAVIGEIAAGLMLGPSGLGPIWPAGFEFLFHPAIGDLPSAVSEPLMASIIGTLSQLGLIFLLFLIGIDFEPAHVRLRGAAVVAISCAGIMLPFGLGVGLARL